MRYNRNNLPCQNSNNALESLDEVSKRDTEALGGQLIVAVSSFLPREHTLDERVKTFCETVIVIGDENQVAAYEEQRKQNHDIICARPNPDLPWIGPISDGCLVFEETGVRVIPPPHSYVDLVADHIIRAIGVKIELLPPSGGNDSIWVVRNVPALPQRRQTKAESDNRI